MDCIDIDRLNVDDSRGDIHYEYCISSDDSFTPFDDDSFYDFFDTCDSENVYDSCTPYDDEFSDSGEGCKIYEVFEVYKSYDPSDFDLFIVESCDVEEVCRSKEFPYLFALNSFLTFFSSADTYSFLMSYSLFYSLNYPYVLSVFDDSDPFLRNAVPVDQGGGEGLAIQRNTCEGRYSCALFFPYFPYSPYSSYVFYTLQAPYICFSSLTSFDLCNFSRRSVEFDELLELNNIKTFLDPCNEVLSLESECSSFLNTPNKEIEISNFGVICEKSDSVNFDSIIESSFVSSSEDSIKSSFLSKFSINYFEKTAHLEDPIGELYSQWNRDNLVTKYDAFEFHHSCAFLAQLFFYNLYAYNTPYAPNISYPSSAFFDHCDFSYCSSVEFKDSEDLDELPGLNQIKVSFESIGEVLSLESDIIFESEDPCLASYSSPFLAPIGGFEISDFTVVCEEANPVISDFISESSVIDTQQDSPELLPLLQPTVSYYEQPVSYINPVENQYTQSNCCFSYWVRYDQLLWTACEDGFDCCYETTNINYLECEGITVNETVELDSDLYFNSSVGFRVGAGYEIDCTGWTGELYWTKIALNGGGSNRANIAKLHFDLDSGELFFGREFFLTSCFSLKPYGGVRVTHVEQKLKAHLEAVVNEGDSTHIVTTINSSNADFLGAGPQINLRGTGYLPYGISFFGAVGASVLYGHYQTKCQVANLFPDLSDVVRGDKNIKACKNMMYLNAGGRWCCGPFKIEMGLEHYSYFNFNKVGCKGDLAIYGGYVSLGFVF